MFSPIPPGLTFWHPTTLIATWFGFGLLRPAPGTWGAVAALPFGWGMLSVGGWPFLLGVTVLVLILGVRAADHFGNAAGQSDSQSIVVDEVVGQWIALLAAPLSLTGFAVALIAFRFYDIIKPWPVSYADKHIKGGLGVMLDDVAAGLYALIVVFLVNYWLL